MATRARSYVHGTGTIPLLGLTVGDVLERAAECWPDRDALVVPYQQQRLSWLDLRREALQLAAGLHRLGLRPGERIGIVAPNCAQWVITQFGTAYLGLILVNINPAYRLPELEYAMRKAGCRALITSSRFRSSDYVEMLLELAPEIRGTEPGKPLSAARLPDLDFVVLLGEPTPPGMLSFSQVCDAATPEDFSAVTAISAALDFDEPINIQFTSGTTGTPKAATLTHHNIVNDAHLSAEIMKLTETDRLCIPVPMYHCFGMVLGTLLCATHGTAIVFASAGFDAGAVLEVIEAERCTALHGVPTMFIAELEEPGFSDRNFDSLRTGIMAGAPCPIELMQRVICEFHLEQITIGYGMTETGPLSTQTSVDDPLEARVGTVGRVLPHTEIKIIDEQGQIVPLDTPGELCTRGYCVMRGYWDDPERTAKEIDAAHWIRSGDVATLDDRGYVRIVGRIKDMIIRGGENIYPREIEEFLYGHPAIEQVEVFGVPDTKYGEQVAAWIKLRPDTPASADDIRSFCKGEIAHFKIPRYIEFVDEFPMTVTGKVQKYVMREQMADRLEQAKPT